MSNWKKAASRSRKILLGSIGLASIAAAVAAQFAPESLFDVKSASTPQLLGLLGLLVLPAVTASALFVDTHFLRRRRRPVPEAVEAGLSGHPVPSPVLSAVPEPYRATAWPTGPQSARAHPASQAGQHARRPNPRIEIIVEPKPAPQILTITRPAPSAKSAA